MKHNVCPDVTIGTNHGSRLKLLISSRLYEDRRQRTISLRMADTPQNRIQAAQRQLELQQAINDGTFDPTLTKYQEWFSAKPARYRNDGVITLGVMWKNWCEYRKPLVAASTFIQKFQGTFTNSLTTVGSDLPINPDTATAVRSWLIDNRNKSDNVWLLSELEKAVDKLINDQVLSSGNPFYGMSKALGSTRNNIIDDRKVDDVIESLNKRIYFLPAERDEILRCFAVAYPHYWLFTYFRFFTGCRFEESTGIKWGDIKADCTAIVFRRTYSATARIEKVCKMGNARRFNCSPQLTDLLMQHRQGTYTNDDALVFTKLGRSGHGREVGQSDKHVSLAYYKRMWGNIIEDLYADGKIAVRLSPKHTRHTLSNLADLAGIDDQTLSQQMGHTVRVMQSHYRDKVERRNSVIDVE